MSEIRRYGIPITDLSFIMLPRCHHILKIAPARDGIYIDMWVRVWPDIEGESRRDIVVAGTGNPLPDERIDGYTTDEETVSSMEYFDTVVMPSGAGVWHVWFGPNNG